MERFLWIVDPTTYIAMMLLPANPRK
jgi:hypothetical protein